MSKSILDLGALSAGKCRPPQVAVPGSQEEGPEQRSSCFIMHAFHPAWHELRIDDISFYGKTHLFQRLSTLAKGHWSVPAVGTLLLKWDLWDAEVLYTCDSGQSFQGRNGFALISSKPPPQWFRDCFGRASDWHDSHAMAAQPVDDLPREPAPSQKHGALPLVAILVPFRRERPEQRWQRRCQEGSTELRRQNRSRQLLMLLNHMAEFLPCGRSRFFVLVVQQSEDDRPFNRGKLLNAGFVLARGFAQETYGRPPSSVIFHDCDLLPPIDLGPYYADPPQRGEAVHLAAPHLFGRLQRNKYQHDDFRPGFRQFFGGVTAVHPDDFSQCNGFPNDHWGWGQEDDQLQLRMLAAGVLDRVRRPPPNLGLFVDLDSTSMVHEIATGRSLEWANAFVHRGCPRPLEPKWRDLEEGVQGMKVGEHFDVVRTIFAGPLGADSVGEHEDVRGIARPAVCPERATRQCRIEVALSG